MAIQCRQHVLIALLSVIGLTLIGCDKQEPKTTPQIMPPAPPQASVTKAQSTCPVMGGAIDKQYFVDYEGQRVYFCCPGCEETFKKDPAKYLNKMAQEGVELEKAP